MGILLRLWGRISLTCGYDSPWCAWQGWSGWWSVAVLTGSVGHYDVAVLVSESRNTVPGRAIIREAKVHCVGGDQARRPARVVPMRLPANPRCVAPSRAQSPLTPMPMPTPPHRPRSPGNSANLASHRPHRRPPHPNNLLRRRDHRPEAHIHDPALLLGRHP